MLIFNSKGLIFLFNQSIFVYHPLAELLAIIFTKDSGSNVFGFIAFLIME
jgi:hypothetical protein